VKVEVMRLELGAEVPVYSCMKRSNSPCDVSK